MAKKADKTTIIFVNQNQSASKPIQVPSSYILHWKRYVAGIAGSFILLLGMVLYLSFSRASVQLSKDALAQELRRSRDKMETASADTSLVKMYYQSIDEKLLKINKYLKARGIKTIQKNKGGEASADAMTLRETGEFYDDYLEKMLHYVAYTPMGYPHIGSITSGYGYRDNPFTGENVESHKGLDIKGRYGELVKATASGKVVFAGSRGGYGNCIVIRHGNGYETYYGHLSKILIKQGQQISAGDKIGKIGSTGRSTGPHLHYEIHRNGQIINPRSFLSIE